VAKKKSVVHLFFKENNELFYVLELQKFAECQAAD